MSNNRRLVFAALIAAGLLWGTTVPLSKLALTWLAPAWLAFARFGVAATVLLLAAGRDKVRAVCRPAVLASGALGYGGSVVLQNLGIVRTSVTHAALIVGATPVLIAIITALWQRTVARPVAWAGFAVSLAGVGLVASGKGGGATLGGDGLVLAAQLISAGFTVAQVRLLRGRDPVAVTGVQFLAAAIAVLPVALIAEGVPHAGHGGLSALLATCALAFFGTVAPFTLFAYAQSRVPADVAGAFLNLEPLVGAIVGAVVFLDPVGPVQAIGGVTILLGIGLSSLQLRRARPAPSARPAPAVQRRADAGDIRPAVSAGPAASGRGPTAARPTPRALGPGPWHAQQAGRAGPRRGAAGRSRRHARLAAARRRSEGRPRRARTTARPRHSRPASSVPTAAPAAPLAPRPETESHRWRRPKRTSPPPLHHYRPPRQLHAREQLFAEVSPALGYGEGSP
jgi:O-acetylserine/cysteine efflux transporter